MKDCLICKIVAGEIPGEVVHVTERTVAFRDLSPEAPTHVLVVPRDHYENAAALAAGDPVASAELVTAAAAVATAEGYDEYRLVYNTGAGAGQSVFHAHLHVLAGRQLDGSGAQPGGQVIGRPLLPHSRCWRRATPQATRRRPARPPTRARRPGPATPRTAVRSRPSSARSARMRSG